MKRGKHELPLDKHTVVYLRNYVQNFDISGEKKPEKSHLHQGDPKTFSQICFYLCSSHNNVFVVFLFISVPSVMRRTPHTCTLGLKSLGMLQFRPTMHMWKNRWKSLGDTDWNSDLC